MSEVDYVVSYSGGGGLVAGTCAAARIPTLCSGAIVETSSGCVPIFDSMCFCSYENNDAVYNIGRLRSVLPGYNPANTVLSAFKFDANDLLRTWIPAIYMVKDGAVVSSASTPGSAPITPSGSDVTICEETYNTEDNPHWVVSWHEPAELAGSGGVVSGIVCSHTSI